MNLRKDHYRSASQPASQPARRKSPKLLLLLLSLLSSGKAEGPRPRGARHASSVSLAPVRRNIPGPPGGATAGGGGGGGVWRFFFVLLLVWASSRSDASLRPVLRERPAKPLGTSNVNAVAATGPRPAPPPRAPGYPTLCPPPEGEGGSMSPVASWPPWL